MNDPFPKDAFGPTRWWPLSFTSLPPGPPDPFEDVLEAALNNDELDALAYMLQTRYRAYDPVFRFERERLVEESRIILHARDSYDSPLQGTFKERLGDLFYPSSSPPWGLTGYERTYVIARRNVRRRWEKLKVWNPEWGIPKLGVKRTGNVSDDIETKDRPESWTWPWERSEVPLAWHRTEWTKNALHPLADLITLRRGLRRSQRPPVYRDSTTLRAGASAWHTRPFIFSRPWFMYIVELCEEEIRLGRIPSADQTPYHRDLAGHIESRWRRLGCWREAWTWNVLGGYCNVGWTWASEGSSPRPENIDELGNWPKFALSASEMGQLEERRTPPRSPSDDYPRPGRSPRDAVLNWLGYSPPLPQSPRSWSPKFPRRSARLATIRAKQAAASFHAKQAAAALPPGTSGPAPQRQQRQRRRQGKQAAKLAPALTAPQQPRQSKRRATGPNRAAASMTAAKPARGRTAMAKASAAASTPSTKAKRARKGNAA